MRSDSRIWLALVALIVLMEPAAASAQDWRVFANLDRYAQENERLPSKIPDEPRVVLMGDSITEMWTTFRPEFFDSSGYINRGISGQTSPQMLLRFRHDVIELEADAVAILAGTNDLAGNSGEASVEDIAGFVMAMADMAHNRGVKVIVCSVLPVIDYPWFPGRDPATKIVALNELLRDYANAKGHTYVDYYSAMVDDAGGLRVPEFTSAQDLVHPNSAGYEVMESLLKPAIQSALGE